MTDPENEKEQDHGTGQNPESVRRDLKKRVRHPYITDQQLTPHRSESDDDGAATGEGEQPALGES